MTVPQVPPYAALVNAYFALYVEGNRHLQVRLNRRTPVTAAEAYNAFMSAKCIARSILKCSETIEKDEKEAWQNAIKQCQKKIEKAEKQYEKEIEVIYPSDEIDLPPIFPNVRLNVYQSE